VLELRLAVEIRPLRAGDLDKLEWDSDRAIQADYVRRTVAERADDIVFVLALADGRPFGRLGIDFVRKDGVAYLWAFSVLPVLQRRGIGTALLRAAEAIVAGSKVDTVEIGADDWNADVMRLYRRLGYAEAGEERGNEGERIVLFRRKTPSYSPTTALFRRAPPGFVNVK